LGRILAFDFGLRRVGVAATDPMQMIANSLETVATKDVYDFVKKYCLQEQVDAFVIGFPFAHGQKENDIVNHINKFAAKLRELYPDKKVHLVDESFTSKMASQTLLMSGVNKKERRRKENIDAIAANIILQTHLELARNAAK
jgi:putative Holliday junction resolvase